MPVTKTAKRAHRSSQAKKRVNDLLRLRLETSIRLAKKTKDLKSILKAISSADKSAKKKVIHQNKAARIKSTLSKLLSKKSPTTKTKSKKAKSSRKK